MVESAIVAVIVFFVLFAVLQCAFLARASLAAHYGASAGARAGAVAANDQLADYDILVEVERAASSMAGNSVSRVVIYRAANRRSSVPAQCLTGPVTGTCNVYTSADFSRPESDFGIDGWAGDDSWAAKDRKVSRATGADYLGVYVEAKAGGIGGPLPQVLNSTSVTRLEAG